MSDGPDLYALLGLAADTPTDKLRQAYEQQIADALRRQDHRRALALSQAFDALAPQSRHQVYSGVGRPLLPDPQPLPSHRRRSGRRHALAPGPRRPRRRRLVSALVAVAVALVVGLLVYNTLHTSGSGGSQPQFPHQQVQLNGPTLLPHQPPTETHTVQTPVYLVQIPTDAPVDTNGLATYECQAPSGVAITRQARPGQFVSCTGGSTPIVPG